MMHKAYEIQRADIAEPHGREVLRRAVFPLPGVDEAQHP